MIEDITYKKRKSIIETMCFFDIFDFALTQEELCGYMLYKKWNLSELLEFTNHEEFLVETKNHVFLRSRSLTVNVRKEKEHRAKKLIKKAEKFVKYMQLLPFVRCVTICNSLSFYDAEKGSDIDLFIITEKRRLFLARSFAWIFTQFLGLRRHGRKVAGRFCLSFMIARDQLNIKHIKYDKDIYLIYWIRLTLPLIGRETYREFIKANDWIHEYFEYEIDQKEHLLPESKFFKIIQKVLEFPLKGAFGNMIEGILKRWQMKHSQKKANKLPSKEGIILSDSMLKFHDMDMRKKYSSFWQKRVNQFSSYFNPSHSDFEKQGLERSHRSRILSGVHSQDTVDMKNEVH